MKLGWMAALLLSTSLYSYQAESYNELSPQNTLIGATPSLQASANYGYGITVATLDTGIVPEWAGFQPNYSGMLLNPVNTAASGICLNNPCQGATLPFDVNGHGTFVASLITGGVPAAGLSGVAPGSNVIAVQVLDNNGGGVNGDIANGIVYAANHGAQILNLSLGPVGTPAQQAAFYSSIANAVNYAASRNAVIVFAGGNEAQYLAGGLNISGFTDSAINHMLFVGSTDADKNLSSFSNAPGAGGFVSKTGKFYSYKNLWLMAQGENIIGASNFYTPQNGFGFLAFGSGTSFSAPQASGAAALLAARWPVLLLNGNLAKLLEVTATDLGAADADGLYGQGLINLGRAMNPVGNLSLKTFNGNIALASGAMYAGGAFGSLSQLSSRLSRNTAYDSFSRDFTVNLSGLIVKKQTLSALGQTVNAPKLIAGKTSLGDGASLAFARSENTLPLAPGGNNNGKYWSVSLSDTRGSLYASGYGFPSSASFGEALWGGEGAAAMEMPASFNALASLAGGGSYFTYGTPLSQNNRAAVSWTQTAKSDMLTGNAIADSNAVSVGVSHAVTPRWKTGVTFTALNENNGLLGASASAGSLVNFGSDNHSNSVAVSSIYALSEDTELALDASIARSGAAHYSDSIVSDASAVYSRSFGIGLNSRNMVDNGDNASLSFAAPLRSYSGFVSLTTSSPDSSGLAVIRSQQVGITPTGTEMNLALKYQSPVKENLHFDLALQGTRDVQNIAGQNDVTGLVSMKLGF